MDASNPSCSIFNLTACFGTPKCNILKYFSYRGSLAADTTSSSSLGFASLLSGSSTLCISISSNLLILFSLTLSGSLRSGSSKPGIEDNYAETKWNIYKMSDSICKLIRCRENNFIPISFGCKNVYVPATLVFLTTLLTFAIYFQTQRVSPRKTGQIYLEMSRYG